MIWCDPTMLGGLLKLVKKEERNICIKITKSSHYLTWKAEVSVGTLTQIFQGNESYCEH